MRILATLQLQRDDIINLSGAADFSFHVSQWLAFEKTPSGSTPRSLLVRSSITLLPAHSKLITQHTRVMRILPASQPQGGTLTSLKVSPPPPAVCDIADRARNAFEQASISLCNQGVYPTHENSPIAVFRRPSSHQARHLINERVINLGSGAQPQCARYNATRFY